MNNNDNLMPTNVSTIIENFSSLMRNFTIKDTEWLIQKEEYERRISELEGEVKAHENINVNLLKRIRMLEYALGKEREKLNSAGVSGAGAGSVIGAGNKPNDNINIIEKPPDNLFSDLPPQQLIKEEDLKMLKERSNRPSLISVLQSIGIDENLANNLFVDFELNRTELEAMIKKNIDEKLSKTMTNVDLGYSNQEGGQSNNNNNNNVINAINDKGYNNSNALNQKQKDLNIINKNDPNSNNPNSIINANNNPNALNTQQGKQIQKENNYSFSFNKSIELRSHFDEVRKLCYLPEMNSLVSVSEDCLIKVWSLKNIFYNTQSHDIEPYLTLRGHTGPLYCTEKGKAGSNLIYTGGNEGLIQIWNITRPEEVSQYGESDGLFNMNVGFFQKPLENEIIWDLKHHPTANVLCSLSSDGSIYCWETASAEEFMNSFTNNNYDKWVKSQNKKANSNEEPVIPTTCEFLKTDSNRLVIGFNDATISTLDVAKNTFVSHYKTLSVNNSNDANKVLYQPNCFVSCMTVPIIYSGFEDNTIKVIDLRSDSIKNTIQAHADAVTSLNLLDDIYLFSVSHDTTIKLWDCRKLNECINSVVGSQKKWDEAMWDSLLIESTHTLCVACADCSVKLYKL